MTAKMKAEVRRVRLYFKPMPWLSIIALACFVFLIHLGNWQKARLKWKTDLLRQIDMAASAEPLASIDEIDELLAKNHPVDFRRIEIDGRFVDLSVNNGAPFNLLQSRGRKLSWRLYQPFSSSGHIVYIATKQYQDGQTPPDAFAGEQKITGYVRLVRPASRFVSKSNPDKNRWFWFNAMPDELDWAKAVSGRIINTRYYIDMQAAKTAADLPVKKPGLRNNHLEYMLTWYSFAFILIVIYLLLHRKSGRLGFRQKN